MTTTTRPRCTDRPEQDEEGLRLRCASVATVGDKCAFHATRPVPVEHLTIDSVIYVHDLDSFVTVVDVEDLGGEFAILFNEGTLYVAPGAAVQVQS